MTALKVGELSWVLSLTDGNLENWGTVMDAIMDGWGAVLDSSCRIVLNS